MIFSRDWACKRWLHDADMDLQSGDVIAILAIVSMLSFAYGWFSV